MQMVFGYNFLELLILNPEESGSISEHRMRKKAAYNIPSYKLKGIATRFGEKRYFQKYIEKKNIKFTKAYFSKI